jgi:Asp-tRNA(Asn)/Glu-tRNA(Gln) amidotransferase A subunit family amidase
MVAAAVIGLVIEAIRKIDSRIIGVCASTSAKPTASTSTRPSLATKATADQCLLALSENCIPWSLLDFPAITVPAGQVGRLPVGLQLVGAPGQDDLLLAVAHAVESALPALPPWTHQAG